jgi:hypothetical protein
MAFSNNDPFERLTFGGVYARSFAVLMERLDLFMVVAIIMYIPYLLIQFTFPVQETTLDPTGDDLTKAENNPFLANDENGNPTQLLFGKMMTLYTELFFSAVCGVIGQAAIMLAVGQMYTNGQPDTLHCLKTALFQFCTLFCGQFLICVSLIVALMICSFLVVLLFLSDMVVLKFLAVFVGIAGVVAYFYISIAMSLYIPAVIIEGFGALGALKRSLQLVSQDFCLVYCTSFCFGFVMGIVNLILNVLTMDGMFGTSLAKLPFLFQFPLSSIIIVVVYFHIRVTHEGLNRDVLARELSHGGGSSVPPREGDYAHVLSMADDNDNVVEATAIAVVEKV